MTLLLQNTDEKISREDFLEFETKIKQKLPISMMNFYLKYNGGQPNLLYVHDKKHVFPFNAFYSLTEIIDSLKWFDEDALPSGFKVENLLHFAYDPGSGNYAMSLRDSDFGRIYFYVLEEKAEIHGEWDSFDEFINSFIANGS